MQWGFVAGFMAGYHIRRLVKMVPRSPRGPRIKKGRPVSETARFGWCALRCRLRWTVHFACCASPHARPTVACSHTRQLYRVGFLRALASTPLFMGFPIIATGTARVPVSTFFLPARRPHSPEIQPARGFRQRTLSTSGNVPPRKTENKANFQRGTRGDFGEGPYYAPARPVAHFFRKRFFLRFRDPTKALL